MLSLVQPVTLNLRYAATSAVDKSASVVHTLPWVHLTSAYCASFVGRVIFVMIVILKGYSIVTNSSPKDASYSFDGLHVTAKGIQLHIFDSL